MELFWNKHKKALQTHLFQINLQCRHNMDAAKSASVATCKTLIAVKIEKHCYYIKSLIRFNLRH